jgi:hypothetical protein
MGALAEPLTRLLPPPQVPFLLGYSHVNHSVRLHTDGELVIKDQTEQEMEEDDHKTLAAGAWRGGGGRTRPLLSLATK